MEVDGRSHCRMEFSHCPASRPLEAHFRPSGSAPSPLLAHRRHPGPLPGHRRHPRSTCGPPKVPRPTSSPPKVNSFGRRCTGQAAAASARSCCGSFEAAAVPWKLLQCVGSCSGSFKGSAAASKVLQQLQRCHSSLKCAAAKLTLLQLR